MKHYKESRREDRSSASEQTNETTTEQQQRWQPVGTPRRRCIAGRVQEGELRKSERHLRHRGIFKGKVAKLGRTLEVACFCVVFLYL